MRHFLRAALFLNWFSDQRELIFHDNFFLSVNAKKRADIVEAFNNEVDPQVFLLPEHFLSTYSLISAISRKRKYLSK